MAINTHTSKVSMLREVTIFSECSDDVLARVADQVEEVKVEPGQVIFCKGDAAESMYIIAEGKVRVHDEDLTLNYLEAGSVFGEMALLAPEPRMASVTAEERGLLYVIRRDAFAELIRDHIGIVRGLNKLLTHYVRARVRDLTEEWKYIQQVNKVTAAAAAVEAGVYDPESLDDVAARIDELGQLARIFQRMVREVHAREQRLRQEVQQLRIVIDENRTRRQVEEITETDYFKELQGKIEQLRISAE